MEQDNPLGYGATDRGYGFLRARIPSTAQRPGPAMMRNSRQQNIEKSVRASLTIFSSQGLLKFLDPAWGVNRFTRIGFAHPAFTAQCRTGGVMSSYARQRCRRRGLRTSRS